MISYGKPQRLVRRGQRTRFFYVRLYDETTGRQSWASTRCESLTAAREWVKTKALAAARGEDPKRPPAENPAFSDACELWLEEKEVTVSQQHHAHLRYLARAFWLPTFGRRSLSSLESTDVTKYLRKRKAGILSASGRPLSATSVNQDRKDLRVFFNWCMRRDWIARSPVDGTEKYSGEIRRRTRYLSVAEQERLLEACRSPSAIIVRAQRNAGGRRGGKTSDRKSTFTQTVAPPDWLYPLVLTALYCGFREKTLLSLQWCDIDETERQWLIPGGKMKSRRSYSAPIPRRVFDELLRYKQSAAAEVVERGQSPAARLSSDATVFGLSLNSSVRRPFLAACARAGLKLTFHSLRGCFLNRCAELEIPIETAMRLSDHVSLDVVLKHYREVRPSELAEAIARFDGDTTERTERRSRKLE